jgi:Stage II sporulation protein E (SpoIIE)/PilZ domain
LPINDQESEPFEWYLFEGFATESASAAGRAVRLGPFATENECRLLLESIQHVPRFRGTPLALQKRRRRRDRRIRAELSVYVRRSATDEKARCARTLDISKSGARLAGFTESIKLGEFLDIRCGDQEAAFQVVWVGSADAAADGQVGVESLTPEVNIWGLDPSQQTEEELPNEIAVASRVQTRLLPQELIQLKTLDYGGICIQARTVGGDYYDFIDMGSGSVGLVLADIAGKGVAAALLMANLQGSLRSAAGIHPRELPLTLASVNRHFYKHTDTHRYLTLFFASYDDPTQELHYVNCGHNPPLLLHKEGIERLTATATVLGLFQDWECSVAEAKMETGDILCIYTDGITEARDKNDREFGEAGLLKVLRESRGLDSASILENVERVVKGFRAGEQEDDVTMVIACAR